MGAKKGTKPATAGQGLGTAVKKMVVRVCPVTAGNPTRMSKGSWERMCAYHLKRARSRKITSAVDKDPLSKFCRKCKGKMVPPELEIIDKALLE